jgi:hypothetical protein
MKVKVVLFEKKEGGQQEGEKGQERVMGRTDSIKIHYKYI